MCVANIKHNAILNWIADAKSRGSVDLGRAVRDAGRLRIGADWREVVDLRVLSGTLTEVERGPAPFTR